MDFFSTFLSEKAMYAIGTIRKRRSSLLSFRLTLGSTDNKDETSDKMVYAIKNQKNDGKMNFCFSLMSMIIQKMKERERNIWLALMEIMEKRR